MEQSPYWEANRFSASQEIPHILWNPEGSLPHSQVPDTCLCPQPDRCSPWPHISLLPNLMSISIPQVAPDYQSRSEAFLKGTYYNTFYDEELLAPRPTPKLEDNPSSAVRDCLLNIFAASLNIGGRSSNRYTMTHHAVVTGTHLSRETLTGYFNKHKPNTKSKSEQSKKFNSRCLKKINPYFLFFYVHTIRID